jgi:hypothetical protein
VSQNPAFLRHLYAVTLIGSALLSGSALLCVTNPAWAGPKDGEAKKLAESAIYEDYLNLQFDAALNKLEQAKTLCEEGCGQSVKATILRDLAVVHFAGKEDRDKALEFFKLAFQADPFIQLDEDLSSDEIKAVFNEARQAVGIPSSSGTLDADADEPAKPAAAAGSHTAPKEQAVDTPVPLYMTAPEDTDAVKLMFKAPGQDKFRSMGLRRYKAGWGGEIDCNAVSKKPGTLEYYFIMYDELGRETGRVGDEFDAFGVAIKNSLSGPGPALPDQSPPGSCKEVMAADCPPGFPGCQTYDEEDWAKEAEVDEGEKPTVWLTLGGALDFLLVPQSNTVCTTTPDYSCFYGETFRDPNANLLNPDGSPVADANGRTIAQQAGNPRAGFEGSGSIPGGLTMATQRILIGVDYAVTPEILLGLRLGYAFGGGPKEGPTGTAFLPFHAEGRVAYWFGGAHKGVFRPFVQVGGGAAQVDAKVSVQIVDPAFGPSCAAQAKTAGQGCLVQTVNAWRKAGTVFGTAGLGAMIATGNTTGIVIEGRGMFLFPEPTDGIAVSGLVGFTLGL